MSSVDFKRVRDSFSLSCFFEDTMGAATKVVSGNVRYSACPACGMSSESSVKVSVRNEKWHCFSCEKKGDVIDAAAAFFGISLLDAASQLSNDENQPRKQTAPKPAPLVVRNQDAINEVIENLLNAQTAPDPSVVAYLQKRGIPEETVIEAISRKILITLPNDPTAALRYLLDVVGRELLEKSGIWKVDSKCPAIVYRPLGFVSANGRGIEFKLIGESTVAMAKVIRYGEPSPCVWAGNEHAMITEGCVDLLSAIVMGSERTIYSIPGASNWSESDEWLLGLKKRFVLLALDTDKAGVTGSDNLFKVLKSFESKVFRYALPEGIKDLNDQLRMMSQ